LTREGDVDAFSFIKKIEDRVHPTPLNERIVHASFRLNTQLEKLEQMYTRLEQKDRDLFQRCVGAQVSKDIAHARIYANECAEIRKIAKVVLGSQLALEKVLLRLETIKEFGDVMQHMGPVMGIVKETKEKIQGIVPQVASELDEVNNVLQDLSDEAGQVETRAMPVEAADENARKVLEETGLVAEQRLREHFPDLPTLETHPPSIQELIPEPATVDTSLDDDIQIRVYDYARMHGEVSIESCARELRTSPENVRTAIERLRDEGRIIVE
jgi:division protein CdvB (Snf7/Vps24/ESCRT-III family)